MTDAAGVLPGTASDGVSILAKERTIAGPGFNRARVLSITDTWLEGSAVGIPMCSGCEETVLPLAFHGFRQAPGPY